MLTPSLRQVALLAPVLFMMGSLPARDSPLVLVGQVVKVVDGDTIDVELQSGKIRVRLHGIDTPETNQPYGTEATEALKSLLPKTVELEPISQDRYERMVARVFVGDLDVNLEMVRRGYAWAYRRYLGRQDAEYCRAENSARNERKGLWVANPWIAPWEWRTRKSRPDLTDYSAETMARCEQALGRS